MAWEHSVLVGLPQDVPLEVKLGSKVIGSVGYKPKEYTIYKYS